MIKKTCIKVIALSITVVSLWGCSSMMSHSGGKEGLYPGTRANTHALSDEDTSWAMKPLLVVDLPFTVLLDTILLPWDIFRKDSSVKSRVEASEQANQAINSAIPPAKYPLHPVSHSVSHE